MQLVEDAPQPGLVVPGAGALGDDLAAIGGGERVQLCLVVLRSGGDVGVADADSAVVAADE